MRHGRSSRFRGSKRLVRRGTSLVLFGLVATGWAPSAAQAGASICEATGGGDKLCKTYGPNRCSGGACRKWVNRCEIKKSGAFYCNYEGSETRCASGGCHTIKTVCNSSRSSESCVTTDPDVCRPSGSGYRTCSSSTNTCKTYGRLFRCVFDQQYTSCKSGSCKEVKKSCRSGSNIGTSCKVSVKKFRTTKPPASKPAGGDAVDATGGDPTQDSTGVAVATGACPDPETYIGTSDQVPPGYYDGCPGI